MDLISAAAEQNRDEALARAMHDTKSMQACRTKVNLPSAEKCEVDVRVGMVRDPSEPRVQVTASFTC